MVRTSRPLVERMTLVWHDWFATSLDGVGSQKLMLNQNKLLRRLSLGSFDTMLREITKDPAMLLWLSGTENTKWSPNENYARELMELFTLGAGHGLHRARRPRAGARAHRLRQRLEARRRQRQLPLRPRAPRRAAASGSSARRGAFDWQDAVRLCLHHPKHASFFVDKLWRYFIPVAPDAGTRRSLEALYRKNYDIRPVVDAILRHPALYTGPRMVKPPAVYTAGLLRGIGRGIDTHLVGVARLGDGPAPLHAAERRRLGRRALARHRHVPRPLVGRELRDASRTRSPTSRRPSCPTEPQALVDAAIEFWGSPTLRPATRAALVDASRTARWATRTRSGSRRATGS